MYIYTVDEAFSRRAAERHLKLQTDQLRQEMARQAQFFKGRAEVVKKPLAAERSQTEAMRRVPVVV